MVDNNDDAWRLGFSRFQYGILFFILFPILLLTCLLAKSIIIITPTRGQARWKKSPQRRSSTTYALFYVFFFSFLLTMMRMMASLGRQPHPIVGVFGIMGGAYLYISIFLPSLGILFFFLCYNVTICHLSTSTRD